MAEHLDHREPISHDDIAQRNLPARYVLGRLDDPERAEFEEHFVTCEKCLTDIEHESEFREAFRSVVAESGLASAPVRSRMPVHLAWAAMLLVVCGASWFAWRSGRQWERRYREERAANEAVTQPTVPVLALLAARGTDTALLRLAVPPSAQWVVLSMDLAGIAEFRAYRATLADASGATLVSAAPLSAVSGESLGLAVRAALLRGDPSAAKNQFLLTVEGETPDGRWLPAARFRFLGSN